MRKIRRRSGSIRDGLGRRILSLLMAAAMVLTLPACFSLMQDMSRTRAEKEPAAGAEADYLVPQVINEATGDPIDISQSGYEFKIYLDDATGKNDFGKGQNAQIGKHINLGEGAAGSISVREIPDAYYFVKVLVESDAYGKDTQGKLKKHVREVDRIIKIHDTYYGRLKGTTQDYISFSNQKQVKLVYRRFLRVGFLEDKGSAKAGDEVSRFSKVPNQTSILDTTVYTNFGGSGEPTKDQLEKGFSVVDDRFADGRLYYIPDYQSIRFFRPGFSKISLKSATAEEAKAIKSSVNFYRYTDNTVDHESFDVNLNNYGHMETSSQGGNRIVYDYFIDHSGVVKMQYGIPGDGEKVTLHFPTNADQLAKSTNYDNEADMFEPAKGGDPWEYLSRGMARVTWGFFSGSEHVNGVTDQGIKGDYAVSKGGTVVFTLQSTAQNSLGDRLWQYAETANPYYTHLNKLVINGHSINLPIPQLKPGTADAVDQKSFSKSAYTYLPTGELVVVTYVPLSDNLQKKRDTGDREYRNYEKKPWAKYNNEAPYYYVTIMNVQGDLKMFGYGEDGQKPGEQSIGPNIAFITDGHWIGYGAGNFWQWRTIAAPTWDYDKFVYNKSADVNNVTTVLDIDHDLDPDKLIVFSGKNAPSNEAGKARTTYHMKDLPYRFYMDAEKNTVNDVGITPTRRLLINEKFPLSYSLDISSKDNDNYMESFDEQWRGRFYDKKNVQPGGQMYVARGDGQGYSAVPYNGPDLALRQTPYWIGIPSGDGAWSLGSRLVRIRLVDKTFKTFTVQYRDTEPGGEVVKVFKEQKDIVFPRTNYSLTSSFDIDENGNVKPLLGNTDVIGKTASGTKVTGNSEAGYITIPELPDGAQYYELLSVHQKPVPAGDPAPEGIPLTPKKFLPGQRVFLGEFLPDGTDFGEAGGIDDGYTVILRARHVEPVTETDKTKAEKSTDMQVKTKIEKYVGETVTKDDLLTSDKQDVKPFTYDVVNDHDMSTATDPSERIYLMKKFVDENKDDGIEDDSSYEIRPSDLIVREKVKSALTVTDRTIQDPIGSTEQPVMLADSGTPGAPVTLARKAIADDTEGIGAITTKEKEGTVTSVDVPWYIWSRKDEIGGPDIDARLGNNAVLVIPYTAQAQAIPGQEISTAPSDPQDVNLTITKRTPPTIDDISAIPGDDFVIISCAAQPEDLKVVEGQGQLGREKDPVSGSYVQLLTNPDGYEITNVTMLSQDDVRVKMKVHLNKTLESKKFSLPFLLRYNYRYRSQTFDVNIPSDDSVKPQIVEPLYTETDTFTVKAADTEVTSEGQPKKLDTENGKIVAVEICREYTQGGRNEFAPVEFTSSVQEDGVFSVKLKEPLAGAENGKVRIRVYYDQDGEKDRGIYNPNSSDAKQVEPIDSVKPQIMSPVYDLSETIVVKAPKGMKAGEVMKLTLTHEGTAKDYELPDDWTWPLTEKDDDPDHVYAELSVDRLTKLFGTKPVVGDQLTVTYDQDAAQEAYRPTSSDPVTVERKPDDITKTEDGAQAVIPGDLLIRGDTQHDQVKNIPKKDTFPVTMMLDMRGLWTPLREKLGAYDASGVEPAGTSSDEEASGGTASGGEGTGGTGADGSDLGGAAAQDSPAEISMALSLTLPDGLAFYGGARPDVATSSTLFTVDKDSIRVDQKTVTFSLKPKTAALHTPDNVRSWMDQATNVPVTVYYVQYASSAAAQTPYQMSGQAGGSFTFAFHEPKRRRGLELNYKLQVKQKPDGQDSTAAPEDETMKLSVSFREDQGTVPETGIWSHKGRYVLMLLLGIGALAFVLTGKRRRREL